MRIYELDHELQILKAKYEQLLADTRSVIANSVGNTFVEVFHQNNLEELSIAVKTINEIIYMIGKSPNILDQKLSDTNYVTSEVQELRTKKLSK